MNAAKSNTATGTTATADRKASYRGRFAPSPTGPLHMGSLVAALASWLDARAHGGTWLIRMEDLDTPRCVPGAAESILATLARFGLESDEPVMFQSTRGAAYADSLEQLQRTGSVYRCNCSRSGEPGIYSGRCRELNISSASAAWRFRLDANEALCFEDAIQGRCRYTASELGDPVVMRRDQIAAYQLAVVVDDAAQRITHVVRGADLLASTAWQLALIDALALPVPAYAHVPVVTELGGEKLSKSRQSLEIKQFDDSSTLVAALALLNFHPSSSLNAAKVRDILAWAVQHWRREQLKGTRTVTLKS